MQQAPHPEDSIIPDPNPEEPMAPRSDQKEEMEEAAGGQSQADLAPEMSESENFQEDDAEAAELARLRCESVRTEEKKQPGTQKHKNTLWGQSYKTCYASGQIYKLVLKLDNML